MKSDLPGQGAPVAPPLTDAVVVDVLRRVDRLLAPLVSRLGRPPALPPAERDQWWADRVSLVVAGLPAPTPVLREGAGPLPPPNPGRGAAPSPGVLGGGPGDEG